MAPILKILFYLYLCAGRFSAVSFFHYVFVATKPFDLNYRSETLRTCNHQCTSQKWYDFTQYHITINGTILYYTNFILVYYSLRNCFIVDYKPITQYFILGLLRWSFASVAFYSVNQLTIFTYHHYTYCTISYCTTTTILAD